MSETARHGLDPLPGIAVQVLGPLHHRHLFLSGTDDYRRNVPRRDSHAMVSELRDRAVQSFVHEIVFSNSGAILFFRPVPIPLIPA